MIRFLCLGLLFIQTGSLFAETPNPNAPYRAERSQSVTYDVDFSVVVTAPYKTKKLRVWLPIPPSDHAQQISKSKLTTFPMSVKPRMTTEKVYGNRLAYFEFDHPQGAQIIRHQLQIKVWQLNWNLRPDRVKAVSQWPESFKPYLRSDQSLILDQKLRDQLEKILPRKQGEAEDLTRIMNWVTNNLTYDHELASLKASSAHALRRMRGHCSDYHGLCAAFGRALGYPTRVTYGLHLMPKNSPSHCKLEAYLPPYGWVSFDVSETQKLIDSIKSEHTLTREKKQQLIEAATRRTTQGFRDNTWLLHTIGTDLELVPATNNQVSVIRTIYAEADGVTLPDPDPANKHKLEHAWMTVHKYVPDRKLSFPYKDWKTLLLKDDSQE